MNCFASVHGHRVLGLAAALWLLASTDAPAQFAFPTGQTAPASQPVATGPVATKPTAQQGQLLVTQARAAMTSRDYKQAVGKYQQLAALTSQMPEIIPDVARLRLDLQIAGVDSTLLTGQRTTSQPPTSQRSFRDRVTAG